MNPILKRELVGTLRTRKALSLQIGVAVLFTLLVVLRWPSDAVVGLAGSQSQQVFRTFGYGLLATLLLLMPAFPATSIVKERKSGTLALLLNSPMSPLRIYAGKLGGALGFALVLLAMSLPAAAACYATGGVDLTGEVLLLYGILLLVTVQYAALGLLVSSYAGSTDSAQRLTYGLVLLFSVIVLGPHQFLQGQSGILADLASYLRDISPVPAVMELLGHGDVGSHGMANEQGAPLRYVILCILSTALVVTWTVLRLNYSIFDRARSQGKITDDRSMQARFIRRLVFLIDPQRRKSFIGFLVNPVMVKEFRCRRFGRSHWLIRMALGCAVLSIALSVLTVTGTMDWDVETVGGILVVLQMALIVLVTPSLSAGMISGEVESRGWQQLQMTPLSAAKILRGKLLAVAWPLLLILLATLPGYAILMYIEPGLRPQIERVLLCLLITAGFALVLGAAISSVFRQTVAATTTAYIVLFALCGGTLLIWLARDAPFGYKAVQSALTVNPVATALAVIKAPGFSQYDLIPANWNFMALGSAASLVVLLVQTWRLTRPQ